MFFFFRFETERGVSGDSLIGADIWGKLAKKLATLLLKEGNTELGGNQSF